MFGKDKESKNGEDIVPGSFSNPLNSGLPKMGQSLSKSSSTTLIASDTEIIGDIKFSGALEIEGSVIGALLANSGSEASVRVLEKGLVQGDISAPKVAINGDVKGAVHSSILELAGNARVEGDVHYSSMEMMRGAQVNGNLLYSEKLTAIDVNKDASASKAQSKLEKTGEAG